MVAYNLLGSLSLLPGTKRHSRPTQSKILLHICKIKAKQGNQSCFLSLIKVLIILYIACLWSQSLTLQILDTQSILIARATLGLQLHLVLRTTRARELSSLCESGKGDSISTNHSLMDD